MSNSHYGSYNNSKNNMKRVTSAKSKNDHKYRKVIYDSGDSKKSLTIDRSKDKVDFMENSSIFQNKMLEKAMNQQFKQS